MQVAVVDGRKVYGSVKSLNLAKLAGLAGETFDTGCGGRLLRLNRSSCEEWLNCDA